MSDDSFTTREKCGDVVSVWVCGCVGVWVGVRPSSEVAVVLQQLVLSDLAESAAVDAGSDD